MPNMLPLFVLKKERSKIRKILLRTLLFLVFFSSVVAVATRNKWVQTQLVRVITDKIHQELGIQIQIAGVEVDFLRNFHLEGLVVLDLKNDTLLSSSSIDFHIDKVGWSQKKFYLRELECFRPQFKMGFYDSSTLFNFEELLALIPQDSTPSKGIYLEIKKVVLHHGVYTYFEHPKAHKSNVEGEFNPSFIQYSQIHTQIGKTVLNKEGTLEMDIQKLSALDRSGFKIDQLKAPLKIQNGNVFLKKMYIACGQTQLYGAFSIVSDTLEHQSAFDQFKYHLWLKKSKITLSDVGSFAPFLKNHDLKLISVDADIFGPLSNIKVTSLTAKTTEGSSLNFSYRLKGLPDIEHLKHTLDVHHTTIVQKDVQRMFKEDGWPVYISNYGNPRLDLHAEFTQNDYRHQGTIQSEVGSFSGDFFIDYTNTEKQIPFSIVGNLEQLRSTIWSQKPSIIDRISGQIDIKGDRFDGLVSSSFNLKNMSLWLNKKWVSKLQLEGNSQKGVFNASIQADNDIMRFGFKGQLQDIGTPNQRLEVEGKMGKFDVYQLGFDTISHQLSGIIELQLKGLELDSFLGKLTVNNARFLRGNTEFQLKHQEINRPDLSMLEFKGDWVDGTVSGPLNLSNTNYWMEQIAHSIAPERFKEVHHALFDSVYIDLNIPQTAWIEEFFIPGLYLSPLTLSGFYFANQNTFDIKLGPLSIEYGRIYMEKAYFSMDKSRKNGLVKSQFRTPYLLIDNTLYDTFSVAMELFNGGYQLSTKLHDKAKRYALALKGYGSITAEEANLHFKETELKIWDQLWKLDRNAMVTFKQDYWDVQNFFLADANHFLDVSGYLSASPQDTLKVDFGNFTPKVLNPFFPKNSFDSIDFKSNGSILISAVRGNFKFFGQIGLNKLMYRNEDLGSANIAVIQTQTSGKVRLEASIRSGPLSRSQISGDIQFVADKEPQLNLVGNFPNGSSLGFLNPFLEGVIKIDKGTFGADIRITGPMNKPKTQGLLRTNEFKIGVDYLGTHYKTGGIFKITDNGISTFRPIKMMDPTTGNFAWLSLAVNHDHYKDFSLDVKIDSIKNMKVLSTTEDMNPIFYGNAWADGKARIYGLFSEIDMDIDLVTREKSKLSIQMPEVEQNQMVGSIVFVNRKSEGIKNKAPLKTEPTQDAIGQINLNIRANPQAEVQFVIDKRLGDIIKGYGSGTIRLVYGRDEKLYLYGKYVIDKGEYAFSLPGVNLLKKINVNKGGSIRWDGDPLSAEVDITGSFEKKISPSTLMISSSSSGASYPTTTFISVLSMKGNLFSPSISFDLQAPELNAITGATGSEINSVLQRIRADKDETMRQSIALLLFGNFLPPSITGATAPASSSFSSTGFAGSSISTLASSVVNDLFAKYGIPTRIQVNIDDVRNVSGNSNTQLFVNSEWFLSERLRLDLNYDPTVAVLVNSVAVPINFNLEYKTSDENWRLKVFSRSNNLILQQNNATTTNGVSGNTLGTGILYRREFDTFKRPKKEKP
jgi:hypothetical protein